MLTLKYIKQTLLRKVITPTTTLQKKKKSCRWIMFKQIQMKSQSMFWSLVCILFLCSEIQVLRQHVVFPSGGLLVKLLQHRNNKTSDDMICTTTMILPNVTITIVEVCITAMIS